MSFIGSTEEKIIKTSNGKIFKLFMTEQMGGYWVATVLYVKDHVVSTKSIVETDKTESYRKACEWVLNNIDDKADISLL